MTLASPSNVSPLWQSNPFVVGFNSRWFRVACCSCRGESHQIIVAAHLRLAGGR
jgi:hypothetical protein